MNKIFPTKLKAGDEVRVVAPSRSMTIISQETRDIANKRFEDLGFKLSFGKHVEEKDMFVSSGVGSRVRDLHDAFSDKNVKAVITVIGGFNANQLLDYIDWNLIKENPKIFCGYSDITILSNSIYEKTGLVTYYGPHYSSFGEKKFFDYTLEHFQKCLMSDDLISVKPSQSWSDDPWYKDQENRKPIENDGWWIVRNGSAKGVMLGGNLCTFNLLHGSKYFPNFKEDTVLFLEDDELAGSSTAVEFDRNLQSIIHQPGFENVKGIIIGRFQNASEMTMEKFRYIIETKKELAGIPIIANVDFGHTSPMITFPIGGEVEIIAGDESKIEILKH